MSAQDERIEPKRIDESFLRNVITATTSYSEGWREVCARLLWAESELAGIDAVMARRPALDRPTRRENVEKAIYTASTSDVYHGKWEAAEARVQALTGALSDARNALVFQGKHWPVDISAELAAIDAALTEVRGDASNGFNIAERIRIEQERGRR